MFFLKNKKGSFIINYIDNKFVAIDADSDIIEWVVAALQVEYCAGTEGLELFVSFQTRKSTSFDMRLL